MKILNNIFVRTLAFRGNIGSLGDFIAYIKSMFFTVHGKKVNLRIFTYSFCKLVVAYFIIYRLLRNNFKLSLPI